MLAKRVIACLDVKDGKVVKGTRFKSHKIMGDILAFAEDYRNQGVDELVFYDITASAEKRTVCSQWIKDVAQHLDIPFCVAGGLRTVKDVGAVLAAGADKISINSPALETPDLINELVWNFGSQCIVIGVDSLRNRDQNYQVYQYTGSELTIQAARRETMNWIREVQDRGAGEIVLNCMANDGVGQGYDIDQLLTARQLLHIPLVASGGAGTMDDFVKVFKRADVDGALAAGVFHRKEITIGQLKGYLKTANIEVRCD